MDMTHRSHTRLQVKSSWVTYAAAATLALGGLFSKAYGDGFDVVVGGLHSPRGLTFAPGGRLYVAEAGGVEGNNSAIDEVLNPASDHASLRTVASGFASSDEIGVDGISALGNGAIFAITGESEEASGPGFGRLYQVTTSGKVRDVANVGNVNYDWTGANPQLDPGGQYPDANPYGILALPGHIYVTDAGANTLNEVSLDGTVTILAYFENNITSDSTPTTVVQGPDGALYIGTLALVDSFRFGPSAKIYRVDPATLTGGSDVPIIGQDHEWTKGLSPIQNMAFGPDGSLYVSELFVHGPDDPVGDVVKIPFNDPSIRISLTGETLPFPGGVAVAPNGTVYAVGWAVSPNGFVARLTSK
jgi:hypothetical protein